MRPLLGAGEGEGEAAEIVLTGHMRGLSWWR
jgi:hypothetical protein